MKRGDRIVAEVSELSPKGDGMARVDGQEVILRGTVPGDRVEAILRRKRKGRFEASVERLLDCRRERISPSCPHFGTCGGCRWQDLAYADQLELKEGMVRDALEGEKISLVPDSILPSQTPFFYRNKMEFSFGTDPEGNLQLGLHVRGRFNRIFDLENCLLQVEITNCIVEAVRRHATAARLPVYDLKKHQGLLRFLVVRDSKKVGGVMVNLVVSEYPCAEVEQLTERVLQEIPQITTWVVSLHQGKAQVAVGQEEFILHGRGSILEECGGVEYEISPRSFFQTNPLQAERLYGIVDELAGDLSGADVLDLYCGTGGISLHLARRARQVWGIESVPEAVADARRNAQRNGIESCTFITGSVEERLNELEERDFGLVVVDPPRAGVHRKALEGLLCLRAPKLIYVSCNPVTLAENLSVLCAQEYRIARILPVDMFPQTPHCEVVASLERVF